MKLETLWSTARRRDKQSLYQEHRSYCLARSTKSWVEEKNGLKHEYFEFENGFKVVFVSPGDKVE